MKDSQASCSHLIAKVADLTGLSSIILILSVLPFIVRLKILHLTGIENELHGGDGIILDIFCHYKSWWLHGFALTGIISAVICRCQVRSRFLIFIAIYSAFAILSTVFAEHRTIALLGYADRHEGLLTNLSYMAAVFLAIQFANSEKRIKLLSVMVLVSATILGSIGIAQFFGHDIIKSDFGYQLMVSDDIKMQHPNLSLNQEKSYQNSISGFFGNSNFTGSYMAMLYLISLCLMASDLSRRWRYPIVFVNILIFVNLIGSQSRAGILAATIAGIIAAFFLGKQLLKRWKTFALTALCCILCAFVMDFYSMRNDHKRFFDAFIKRDALPIGPTFGNLKNISLEEDSAIIEYDDTHMTVTVENERLTFYDKNRISLDHRIIIPEPEENVPQSLTAQTATKNRKPTLEEKLKEKNLLYLVTFTRPEYRQTHLRVWPDKNLFNFCAGSLSIFFNYTSEGMRILNHNMKPSQPIAAEAWGFNGKERFGTGRGYIWSRSLPMLRNTLLTGYGPDTFAAHFPNNDLLGKLKHVSNGIFRIIDKPHNLYLQIAINTGVISLLFILMLLSTYLWESARIYWRMSFGNFSEMVGLGISLAVVAYLITGLFNDSVITVAPVFWSLLGLGIATNRINGEHNHTISEKN